MVEEDVVVRADPDRLMQVVVNLISNAIKFSPEGANVEVVAARAGIEGELTVRDYGPGVPEAFRDRLFGKFAQADGARATGAGSTGLGLAISREIAERLGGRIWHEPAPGEGGASFTIALPLSHASLAAQACEGERVEVLHVDDDPDTLRLVAQALAGRAGVRSVTSLAEAGRALESSRPDVIILDMALPGESAADFLDFNAASARPVPVVIFSALDIDPGRERRAARVFTKARTTLGELITGVLAVAARLPDEPAA
jgi:CheY-like chemotaxis protein